MSDKREDRLILEGSPCGVNYFHEGLLTVQQTKVIGMQYCPNYTTCESDGKTYCSLRSGLEVAQNVVKGNSLKKELEDFSRADFLNGKFWTSLDGKIFKISQGKSKFIAAVERFARVVLLLDPLESVFPRCDSCKGVKLTETVYDSIHDGPFPLSGSGKTKSRSVEYCPDCDPKPQGGIIKEDPYRFDLF